MGVAMCDVPDGTQRQSEEDEERRSAGWRSDTYLP